MRISSRQIPKGHKIIQYAEPVLGLPGVEALSPRLASVIGRWSEVEKQLDNVFALLTAGDEEAYEEFSALRGWDRKFQRIKEAAKALPPEAADMVRAVFNLAKSPAAKRDELAHGRWAIVEGFEGDLALLPPRTPLVFAKAVALAKSAGTARVPINTDHAYEEGCLVSASDLDQLIAELVLAKQRLDALVFGYLLPPFLDVQGKGFSDSRDVLSKDVEVNARVKNMARARQRTARGGAAPYRLCRILRHYLQLANGVARNSCMDTNTTTRPLSLSGAFSI